FVWVKSIENVGQTISDVLRRELLPWHHPWQPVPGDPPSGKRRTEFYEWLLDLEPTDRLIRYGCDRYFNKLVKRPRTIRAKVKKRRRYPFWLQPYMFGNGRPDPNS